MFQKLFVAVAVIVCVVSSVFADVSKDEIKLVSRAKQKAEFYKNFEWYINAVLIDKDVDLIADLTYQKIERLAETNFVAASALATMHRELVNKTQDEEMLEHLKKAAYFYDNAIRLAQDEKERQTMRMGSLLCKMVLASS